MAKCLPRVSTACQLLKQPRGGIPFLLLGARVGSAPMQLRGSSSSPQAELKSWE